jgi:dephospho-CoA kinase
MTIVALVGMCGSGKSVAADFLNENNYTGIHFGSLTMDVLKERGFEITPENERSVREELREKHGMAAFAVLSINKIKKMQDTTDKIYIDGLYSWEELTVLEKNLGNITLIHIFTDKHLRYERLSIRPHRPLTPGQARERDIKEIENIAKGGPIAFADFTILNNNDLNHYKSELQRILQIIEQK